MTTTSVLKCSLIVAAAALSLGTASVAANDAAVEEIEPLPAHLRSAGVPAAPVQPVADPRIRAAVLPPRGGLKSSAPDADPVAESFARMLTHRPHAAAPAIPSGLGADPLIGAMVEPLRQGPVGSAAVAPSAGIQVTRTHGD